mmetsp:Transcript_18685/g.28353  ORF Transcript_18685/g.28353 Transcript_18685/m.28353 type:complete len:149 (-) Transcript_18685:353-799(-)
MNMNMNMNMVSGNQSSSSSSSGGGFEDNKRSSGKGVGNGSTGGSGSGSGSGQNSLNNSKDGQLKGFRVFSRRRRGKKKHASTGHLNICATNKAVDPDASNAQKSMALGEKNDTFPNAIASPWGRQIQKVRIVQMSRVALEVVVAHVRL